MQFVYILLVLEIPKVLQEFRPRMKSLLVQEVKQLSELLVNDSGERQEGRIEGRAYSPQLLERVLYRRSGEKSTQWLR